ncbi:MAG: hypothetical protein LBI36_04680 [Oscillospiraceae bacterium]|jgi:hypothetical protein|nr:hypothetical protein [Oscillospiraceae bacterium]
MSFDIKRETIYVKYSPEKKSADDEENYEGLELYEISRPKKMDEEDFETLLNFFRRVDDEMKFDGVRFTDDVLTSNNLHFFCLKSGAVMFKIIKSGGQAELYGFFVALSDVRTAWLYIDKLCYMLAGETPAASGSGIVKEEELFVLDVNSFTGLPSALRSSLMDLGARLSAAPFPESFALTCLPKSFFPDGVKVYENGFMPEKTSGEAKERTIELDDALLTRLSDKCKEPLKSAVIMCVSNDDEGDDTEVKKGGLFGKRKKGQQPREEARAVKQWRYEFISNLQRQSENCDFIHLNEPIEYSPVADTFYAYVGVIPGSGDDAMIPASKIPGAEIYVPGAKRKPSVASIDAAPARPPSAADIAPSVPVAAPETPFASSEPFAPSAPFAGTEPMIEITAPSSGAGMSAVTPRHSPTALSLDMDSPVRSSSGKSAWDGEPETRGGNATVLEVDMFGGEEPARPKFGYSQADKSAVEDMMPHPIYMRPPETAAPPSAMKPTAPIFEVTSAVEDDEADEEDITPDIEITPYAETVGAGYSDIEITPLIREPGLDIEVAPRVEVTPPVRKPEPPAEITPPVRKPEPPVELTPFVREAKPVTSVSPLPPPPAPVTITPLVWSATSAEIEDDGETSGEMEAVTLKPKSSGNSVMDLYYQNLNKHNPK